MKRTHHYLLVVLLSGTVVTSSAQTSPVQKLFPAGTVFYQNIPYANDSLQKHLLDIYLPPNPRKPLQLIVWINAVHGC